MFKVFTGGKAKKVTKVVVHAEFICDYDGHEVSEDEIDLGDVITIDNLKSILKVQLKKTNLGVDFYYSNLYNYIKVRD